MRRCTANFRGGYRSPGLRAVTFLCLGLGFYDTYRRGGCARMRDKAILWTSTLLVLALLGYSLYVEGPLLF